MRKSRHRERVRRRAGAARAGSGAITSMNSSRPCLTQTCASGSRSALLRRADAVGEEHGMHGLGDVVGDGRVVEHVSHEGVLFSRHSFEPEPRVGCP